MEKHKRKDGTEQEGKEKEGRKDAGKEGDAIDTQKGKNDNRGNDGSKKKERGSRRKSRKGTRRQERKGGRETRE